MAATLLALAAGEVSAAPDKVTAVYRRLEVQVMLEDGCAEGIWREALEKTAGEAP
jgi:hypothetical protein